MAQLKRMPAVAISQADLAKFGEAWVNQGGKLDRGGEQSSTQLGLLFDNAVGEALATMLGGVPIVRPSSSTPLIPPEADCVEVGPVLVIGGVRPQHFDVAYRPDGVRFVFDSKTLNSTDSIRKNWQNMINDLATQAATVHSRFPHAIVGFLVALPDPSLEATQRSAIMETLERLARRVGVDDPAHLAEAIALVLWDPANGIIDPDGPEPSSPLRIERFSEQVEAAYSVRYGAFPPHAV
jgi:hypothetical protein